MAADRAALAVPGRMLGPHVPTLYYCGEAAEARGARVEVLHWPGHPDPVPLDADTPSLVESVVEAALDDLLAGLSPVLFAKSMGTLAAPVAARRHLPAVWLTPVLTDAVGLDPRVFVDAVEASTAPCLIVGGTGDSLWDGELARRLSPHVVEVPGADHGLHLPGVLAATLAVMAEVITAVEDFLDEYVWPAAEDR